MEKKEKHVGGVSAFTLKCIAIIGMTLDHIGIAFSDYVTLPVKIGLFAFGGLTFPIMAYMLVEGYRHTRNIRRYALRMFIFALISQIPYSLTLMKMGNVLFTLLLGLITLYLYDHMENRVGFWAVFALITAVTLFLDWSLIGVPMILLYATIKGHWQRLIIPVLLPIGLISIDSLARFIFTGDILSQLPSLAYVFIGCTLTIPLLHAYQGRQGRRAKYLFYAFYPGHILILWLIKGLMFNEWSI